MDLAIVIAIVALVVSGATATWQIFLTRHGNTVPVLIDLFREHRGPNLARIRGVVYNDVPQMDLSKGLPGLPQEHREDIRDLLWFYDNLGVLVVHRIIDIRPVSGYLGSAAVFVWNRMKPMILSERERRVREGLDIDPGRWQHYFELLVEEIRLNPPGSSRAHSKWPWARARRYVLTSRANKREKFQA